VAEDEAAAVAEHEWVVEVAAVRFAAGELGPRPVAPPPCRDLRRADLPAAPWLVAADGQPRGRAVAAVARILEIYRHPAVGLAAIWLGELRVPAVARVPTCRVVRGQGTHGPAPVASRAAARDPAVVPRKVIWETFLICRVPAAAVRVVRARVQQLPAAPRGLQLEVQPRTSCRTDHQHNPVSQAPALRHVLVPATLPPTFHVRVREAKA
jgi:hypothetical protein